MDRFAPTDPRPEHPLLAAVARSPYWNRRLFLKRQPKPGYPRFLYKYRTVDPSAVPSVEHLRDVIARSRLWLSTPLAFNDPFDMSSLLVVEGTPAQKRNRFKNLIDQHSGLNYKKRRQMLEKFAAKPNDEILRDAERATQQSIRDTGVYSFAGDPKSILMWSHYGANHNGICLQFEIARDTRTFLKAIAVDYDTEYPILNWLDDTAEQLKVVLLRKAKVWEYEEERRIVVPNGASTYLPFDPIALTGVILGCRTPAAVVGLIDQLLLERTALRMPLVSKYAARKHGSQYRLVVTRS